MDAVVADDVRSMVSHQIESWVAIGLVGVGTVLAILVTIAHARREELRRHDLRVRVNELRAAYQRRLAEIRRGTVEAVAPESEPASNPEPVLREAA
jgi:type VI protein secretion system component VasK